MYMAEVRVRLVDAGASVGKEVEEEGATTYDCWWQARQNSYGLTSPFISARNLETMSNIECTVHFKAAAWASAGLVPSTSISRGPAIWLYGTFTSP